jgi:putative ATP-dependent endonuclease of OLD family
MQISKVHIRNYRSLADLEIPVGDYMALIGSNGAGKSSVLYALDWFFNGGDPEESDIHRPREDGTAPCLAQGTSIEVEVTFSNLTPRDREVLGMYGRGPVAQLRRTCSPPAKGKLIGSSRQGPGFVEVRNDDNAKARKERYAALRTRNQELPVAASEKDILAALEAWEQDPRNQTKLVSVPADASTHMFGFNGESTLRDLVRYVLIPAASDLASEVGTLGRGSALGDLMGGLLSRAVAEARTNWEETHADEIRKLETAMTEGVDRATSAHAVRINGRLSDLLPDAEILFSPQVPSWQLRGEADLRTSVMIDGAAHDVARQGHGVQRAVMMAVLQAFAPSDGGPDATESDQAVDDPALVVAIEEPEIYQHPVRARHFGRALTRLSNKERTQVCIASHSPYFIRPEQFEGLRRITLADGNSRATSTT